MKGIKLLLIGLLFLNFHTVDAQVFVDGSATGLNDGSSWANAYTDLNSAIAGSSANSELWIAAGVYKPGTAPTDRFLLLNDIRLYGGFNGTETMLSQRDFETNLTILSGDILGDDIAGDFSMNKTDNSRHILWCHTSITNSTIIDGLIFEGGNTLDGSGTGDDRRGGAILTYGAPIVQNCLFRQNYGFFGASVYPRNATANETKVLNCTFEDNYGENGTAVMIAFAEVLIEDCIVQNNTTTEGGAITIVSGPVTIRRSEFPNNTGGFYGGASIYAYDLNSASTKLIIEDCNFDSNHSPDFGGAVSIQDNIQAFLKRCEFTNNTSDYAGAAITFAFNSNSTLENCIFKNNVAPSGGVSQIQDSTYVSFDSCVFEGNYSTDSIYGGGVIVAYGGDEILIKNSEIKNNFSTSKGGVIASSLYAGVDFHINIENTYISNNRAYTTGGAFHLDDTNLSLTNCVITNDSASLGSSIYSFANGTSQTITLVNTTVADHEDGPLLAQETINNGVTNIDLLNTILDNPSITNYVELSLGTGVQSNGGNLSSDASLSAYLTGTNDLNSTSANFFNPSDGDYHLAGNSPCINTGIDTGAPLLDIEGNNRVGITDMGVIMNYRRIN